MGLIRKSLRAATLPLGPAGVKGSSKKQRVAKATLRANEAQLRVAQGYTGDPLRDQRLRLAEARVNLSDTLLRLAVKRGNESKIAKAQLELAKAELHLAELRNTFGV